MSATSSFFHEMDFSSTAYDILEQDVKPFDDMIPIPACLSQNESMPLSTFPSSAQEAMIDDDDSAMDLMFGSSSSDNSEAAEFVSSPQYLSSSMETDSSNPSDTQSNNSAVKQKRCKKSAKRSNSETLKNSPVRKQATSSTMKKDAAEISQPKTASFTSSPQKQTVGSRNSATPTTVLLPSGTSVQIIGKLHPNFTLQLPMGGASLTAGSKAAPKKTTTSNPLKRKRSELKEKEMTQEELKKAAKRQRNRVLAQQSRDRKKKYVENLEKENAELCKNADDIKKQLGDMEQQQEQLKHAMLLSTKKRVVLCMLICMALLVVSQQTDEIPSRLSEVELPADLPKDISKLDLITEQYTKYRSELEKELSMALPPSVLQSIAVKVNSGNFDSDKDSKASAATRHLVHEISQVLKEKEKLKDGKDANVQCVVKSRRKGKSQSNVADLINAQHCDSEDSDEDNQQ